jgi:hypothetical protein
MAIDATTFCSRTMRQVRARYLLRGSASGGFENVIDVIGRGVMSAELWRTHDGRAGDYDGDGRRDVLLEARDEQHDTFVVRVAPP